MSRVNGALAVGLIVLGGLFFRATDFRVSGTAEAQAPVTKPAESKAHLDKLEADIKKLQELIPDQAAVMSHLSYHFTNLWFAGNEENWPLADFYLSETRSNLRWAVRAKPIRKDLEGKDTVLLAPIAEAVENGPFKQMKDAIQGKDKAKFVKVYTETLSSCYACHKASFKPYLRPQIPTAPETRVINFDPKAKTPE
jgi:hypothetical protein